MTEEFYIYNGYSGIDTLSGTEYKEKSVAINIEAVPPSPVGVLPNSNGLEALSEEETSSIDIQINSLKIRGFIYKPELKPSEIANGNAISTAHITNKSSTAVANFLNIPYARIPARFRQSVLINPRQECGTIDATKYGPRCPQPVDVLHDATKHLYPRMGTFNRQSEFECLNLNIYTPLYAINTKQNLPVLVWIHGGAFTYGDGGCESGQSAFKNNKFPLP